MDTNQITGLILAGGRGTRMGTVDKGLQTLHDTPLVSHVIDRLAPQVGPMLLNANQNQDVYAQFGIHVIADSLQGFAGPLAGVQAGLEHCKTEFMATVPCDSPYFPDNLVSTLYQALNEREADLAVAVTGEGEQRQQHPVFCLLRRSLLPHLNNYLREGNRKFALWYASLLVVEVHFEDERAFLNINTLDELRQQNQ
ncbi:molybdenum cofactor guanylyltransferase MobA [Oxalicibacterium faecigallinarum]|uniref:Molybdenum cofactor guanylyltransferase n=1 Tax=Oxalicibacterium faecigallinarum TaxID=573741 RepID=A0A8J3AQA4_9BURK|nr:molybdenum cofactor guanylyltransferase MobA [Oxalicibacterium faecigallinarum]GGI16749.1 molybdenum cofactor guanylyltransferase [Oxalicibacterium faecigallinarum]